MDHRQRKPSPMTMHAPIIAGSIWHAGEKTLQARAGVAEHMEEVGRRVIRDFMPDQHRAFYAQLPFVIAGAVDESGDPWATVLTGRPGFIASSSPISLDIHIRPDPADPAGVGLKAGDALGLLGIELHTRRRNRMNGTIAAADHDGLHLTVDQSFGNCPQYIQLRDAAFVCDPETPFDGAVQAMTGLDAASRRAVEAADTFFVASYAEREGRRQVDVSHRGGKPGFVRVGDDGLLTIPDFSGNLFFSTLGNILMTGKAGLVFVDFETGGLLQMTGDAEVILDSPEIAAFQGAERLWTFRPRRILRRPAALPLRWASKPGGAWPRLGLTGN